MILTYIFEKILVVSLLIIVTSLIIKYKAIGASKFPSIVLSIEKIGRSQHSRGHNPQKCGFVFKTTAQLRFSPNRAEYNKIKLALGRHLICRIHLVHGGGRWIDERWRFGGLNSCNRANTHQKLTVSLAHSIIAGQRGNGKTRSPSGIIKDCGQYWAQFCHCS